MVGAEIHEDVISRIINGIQIETIQLSGQYSNSFYTNGKGLDNFLNNPDELTRMFQGLNPNYSDTVTWQDVVKECILPSYHSKNLIKLEAAYNKELTKRTDYLVLGKKETKDIFARAAYLLAELPFIDATFELTKGNGFKFILVFPKNKLLMISKSLNKQSSSLSEDEIFFSLFINNELIASNADELENFKEGFNKYLSM